MKADHHEGGVKIDKNSISVHSTGEISLIPDAIQFTVTVTSNKETVEEAQASVKRRTDYVSQVVRKTGIHSEIPMSTEITKSSGGMTSASQGDMVTVCTEVVVKCDSLNKCETIKNVLIEKMDSSVHFSPVAFWLSAEAKQNGRYELKFNEFVHLASHTPILLLATLNYVEFMLSKYCMYLGIVNLLFVTKYAILPLCKLVLPFFQAHLICIIAVSCVARQE